MRQLTALDAQFLRVETATTTAHVAGLAILDSADGTVTKDALADLLLARLHLSPALYLRVAEVPFGLDHPYWVSDPHFDIGNHLFETALPLPGDDQQLADAVADIHSRRLDRAHPLWEMHLITGLAGGRVAVYTKVHHAAIDGVSGAETLAALLDLTPDGHLRRRGGAGATPTRSAARTSSLRRTASPPTAPPPADLPPATDSAPSAPVVAAIQPPVVTAGLQGAVDLPNGQPVACLDPTASGAPGPLTAEAAPHVPATTESTPGGQHDLADKAHGGSSGGQQAPGLFGMLAGAAVRTMTHPFTAMRSVVRAAGDLDAIPVIANVPGAKRIAEAARVVAGERRDRPGMPPLTAPRTPFNGPITAQRHLSFGSLSLKDVKNVAKAHGISVNDVIMTLCTSALRSWLSEHDALPEAPLVVAVPVAVRTGSAKEVVGNQISAMVTPLPTNVADPKERLRAVGAAMAQAKRRFALAPATWPSELCSVLPAPLATLATPAVFRLAGVAFPPINLIISNVPGPQFPLYLCGGRLLSYYPLSVVTDMSGGLSITCFSYDGMIDFGLVACPERVDDVWSLIGHLRAALDEVLDERVGDEFRDGVGVDLVAG
ncbi:acyltransferase, WS/DGAT/MGAT [Nonomuraea maritima]|uniref:diacylglycerol O-acyltransferase n=1 Tax=Nonomuraea maritima TaxID=683260 RepID=A0A1G8Y472_9ACTN|nr:wax ester/triacylglycerol synthase domain-containing protein [Nonomuraea maritima]SDJ97571.1 acyltransferase, WS/DGAT/MGAT [Nonomuraea maritima]